MRGACDESNHDGGVRGFLVMLIQITYLSLDLFFYSASGFDSVFSVYRPLLRLCFLASGSAPLKN
jgi:hypothetical protein